MTKVCIKCGIEKDITLFRKKRNICKECNRIYHKKYQKENKYRISIQRKEYRDNNKHKRKEYYLKNRDKEIKYQKEYYHNNNEQEKKKRNARNKNRYKTEPVFRTMINIRNTISRIFYQGTKTGKTIELLGCDIDLFMTHIETQFTEEMNWDNQGEIWHLDHIKPIASFKNIETCPIEQRLCSNWRNFQPLLAKDNLEKGDKWDDSLEENIKHLEYLQEALKDLDVNELELII